MTHDEYVAQARAALPKEGVSGYVVDLNTIAEQLQKTGGPAAPAFAGEKLRRIADRYRDADREANAAQKRFRKWSSAAGWGLFAATAAAAVLSAVIMWWPEGDAARILISLVVLAAGGVATYAVQLITRQKLLESWMTNRADAETERLAWFGAAIELAVAHARQPQIDRENRTIIGLIALEVFQRFQVDVQLEFYAKRGAEHRERALKIAQHLALGAVGLWVCSGGGGILSTFTGQLAALAPLGLIASAWIILKQREESIGQHDRIGERYKRTGDGLNRLAERYDDVQRAITSGADFEALEKYVRAVDDLVSTEHRQWLGDADERMVSIRELDEALATPDGAEGTS